MNVQLHIEGQFNVVMPMYCALLLAFKHNQLIPRWSNLYREVI